MKKEDLLQLKRYTAVLENQKEIFAIHQKLLQETATLKELHADIKDQARRILSLPPGPQGKPGKDGKNGLNARGVPGKDGQTPIKGKDYWTPADKEELTLSIMGRIRLPKDGETPVVDYDKAAEKTVDLIVDRKLLAPHFQELRNEISSYRNQLAMKQAGQHGGGMTLEAGTGITLTPQSNGTVLIDATGGGTGTVTTVSVATANGFAGTVANATTTPAITLTTTVTGILKGNGTAISAAVANTDYQVPIILTTTGSSGAATFDGTTLNIPEYVAGGGTVDTVVGTADRITVNSTDPANPIVDIASTYVGQSSITTLGTIATGTWEATDIGLAHGGTGASLSDPAANAVFVWDDTTNATRLALLSGLTYDSGTNTLTASGSGVTFGSDNQVPYTNSAGNDFDYSANFLFDGAKMTLIGAGTGQVGALNITRGDAVNQYIVLQESGASAGSAYLTFAGSNPGAMAMGALFTAGVPTSYVFTDTNGNPMVSIAEATGLVNVNSLTASEIVITDASKNLVSAGVATYPSLTELTYLKGVTSAIQTQLNGKQATLTPAALTRVDDTNVTLTLGGTPATSLLQAVSLTLGWSGQLSLARGGTGANLSDPNADRILFWDDSAGTVTWLTAGSGLTITDTTLIATGLGGDVVGPASATDDAIVRFDGTTGKLIQNYTSGAPTISDTGAVTIPLTTGNSLVVDTSVLVADASNNRVGIGTASPQDTLHISDSGATQAIIERTGSAVNANVEYKTTGGSVFAGIGPSLTYVVGSASDLSNAANRWFQVSSTVAAFLNVNVGIGDATPAALFTVGANDAFQVNTSGRVLANIGASGADNLSYSFVTDTDTGFYRSAANEMRFQTAGADRMTIDASGEVGIGTTAPAFPLHVVYSAANIGIQLESTATTSSSTFGIFDTYRSGQNAAGQGVGNVFSLNDAGNARQEYAYIGTIISDATAGSEDGSFIIRTTTDGVLRQNGITVLSSGNTGFSVAVPTAVIHLKAGTATASTAPLKFTAGTALTSPEAGTMEFSNSETGLTFTAVSTRRQVVLDTATQTLTDKTMTAASNRVLNTATDASTATPTPTGDRDFNHYSLTALATAPTFAAPSGTPREGNRLTIRIHDNGTARALGWNAIYTSTSNATLPTTTAIGKSLFVGFLYDSTDSVWRCVAVTEQL